METATCKRKLYRSKFLDVKSYCSHNHFENDDRENDARGTFCISSIVFLGKINLRNKKYIV